MSVAAAPVRGAVRALLLQFTEPQRYPPVQHVAEILLAHGCDVQIAGARLDDGRNWAFADALEARVYWLGGPTGGWRGRWNYVWFLLHSLWRLWWWRPAVVWLSDPAAAPLARPARWCGAHVVYHEHDLPAAGGNVLKRWIRRRRRGALKAAHTLVFPGQPRATAALAEAGLTADARCHVVWNLPSRAEAVAPESPDPRTGPALGLYFHGSINATRLPLSLLDALAAVPGMSLAVVGYETVGSVGYMGDFLARARSLGVSERVHWHGSLELAQRLAVCRAQDLGLCFYGGADPNHLSMLGPSNKPFDYLACRLALLVPDAPDWRQAFVEPGYGFALPTDDPQGLKLTALLRRLAQDPEAVRACGRAGWARVHAEWNYAAAFRPVLARLPGITPLHCNDDSPP